MYYGIPYPISENWNTFIDLAVNVIVTMHDIRRYVVFMFFWISWNGAKWKLMKKSITKHIKVIK